MKRSTIYWFSFAFGVTFIATILGAYWNGLETRMETPAGTKWMLGVAVAAAALCRGAGGMPAGWTIIVVGVAMPAGEFVNIIVSIVKDPTSMNLWPLALFLVGVMGFMASAAGTLLGSVARWALGRAGPHD